jgi:hypothetical protein
MRWAGTRRDPPLQATGRTQNVIGGPRSSAIVEVPDKKLVCTSVQFRDMQYDRVREIRNGRCLARFMTRHDPLDREVGRVVTCATL